ncbi:hypothetical protein H2199_007109 [Coniosporium tulheliwenetii]|uniref:Uncharacterized protein n=1 Tax=Coniosporium tulheliwenetii TaxID=3383036 RepID=A0ACC2YT23_9PEZI|nr:hypothetical protein H2199_007109 [Cladosporium sp. JES 115]
MPGPSSPQARRTAKQPATPSKLKPADSKPSTKQLGLGSSNGAQNTASVQDKIHTWQTHGGGVVTSDDGIVVIEESAADRPPTGEAQPPSSQGEELVVEVIYEDSTVVSKPDDAQDSAPEQKCAPSPRKIKHNELDEDVRAASAPKKRVVSDEHWKKARSPQANTTPKTGKATGWVRPAVKPVSRSPPKVTVKAETSPIKKLEPNPQILAYLAGVPRRKSIPDGVEEVHPTRRGSDSGTTEKSEDGPQIPLESSHRRRRRRRKSGHSNGRDENPRTHDYSDSEIAARYAEDFTQPTPSPASSRKEGSGRRRKRRSRDKSPRSDLSADYHSPIERRRSRRAYHSDDEGPAGNWRERARSPVERRRSRKAYHSGDEGQPHKWRDRERLTSPERPERDRVPKEKRPRRRVDDVTGNPSAPVSPKPRPVEEVRTRRRLSKPQPADLEYIPTPLEPAQVMPPKVFGSRVEAWLGSTPDPFVERQRDTRRRSPSPRSEVTESQVQSERRSFDDTVTTSSFIEADSHGSMRRAEVQSNNPPVRPRSIAGSGSVETSDYTEVSGPSTVSYEPSATSISSIPILKPTTPKRDIQPPTKRTPRASPLRNETLGDDGILSAAISSVDPSTVDLPNLSLPLQSKPFQPRRMFPSTGKRLSTIVSVETFNTQAHGAPSLISKSSAGTLQPSTVLEDGAASESVVTLDADSQVSRTDRVKSQRRKLATHADLLSVLSISKGSSKSIVSARSIRTNRSRLATATIEDLMNELSSDEAKYIRELRTLVDGVIPVLLTCVLSKSDAAVAAGLFGRSMATKNDPSVTQPIVDMGIALERLKSLHKRIPQQDPEALLSWAKSASRGYADYIKAWRLGFQDVVVNLAPATGKDSASVVKSATGGDDAAWDEGMPRNEEGYVVDADGERVDVAFLLKRPLVRLKYLAKTFKSEQAEAAAIKFQNLVIDARKRSNEEKARLEDEAAASIDPSRARDPRSLAPVAGVTIDPLRCVRARDYFDLHLPHSSGQKVDCRAELLLRDDAAGRGNSGDVLICEVDNTGRWLLFPPVQLGRISARSGDSYSEIVVMIRGYHSGGQEWRELMTLRTDNEQAGLEWIQMLGLNPVPPKLPLESFAGKVDEPTSSHRSPLVTSAATASALPLKSRTPSPREIEVPIGERAKGTSKQWDIEASPQMQNIAYPELSTSSPIVPTSRERNRLQKKPKNSPASLSLPIELDSNQSGQSSSLPHPTVDEAETKSHEETTPRSLNEAMSMAGSNPPSTLKRTKAKRYRESPRSPTSPAQIRQQYFDQELMTPELKEPIKPKHASTRPPLSPTSSFLSDTSQGYSVWFPPSEQDDLSESDESDKDHHKRRSSNDTETAEVKSAESIPR